mmetsp:Transcript_3483/g.12489  ORF Transcript_3483/g.12489 Transcript_3483/m.12489 type:complete len:275 (-) Transcript_3483:326-1150(-)
MLEAVDERGGELPRLSHRLGHHVPRARVHHPRGASEPERLLRQLWEDAAHGDEAKLLFDDRLHLDAVRCEALREAVLEVVERDFGARDEARLLNENLGRAERHAVQKRRELVVPRASLGIEVVVAPVHEEHLVERERVVVHLDEDAVRRLIPGRKVALKLNELVHMPGGVEHRFRGELAPVRERHNRAALAVLDAVDDAADKADAAAVAADVEQLPLQLFAIHLRVRALQHLGFPVAVPRDDASLVPNLGEAVAVPKILKFVNPNAIVVGPSPR